MPDKKDNPDYRHVLLQEVDKGGEVDTSEFAKQLGIDHSLLVGAVKSLQAQGKDILKVEQVQTKSLQLTSEGREVVDNGSHEARLYATVPADGILQKDLMTSVPNAKVGFSKAMSAGWIRIDKAAEGGPRVYQNVDSIDDTVQTDLKKINRRAVTSNDIPDDVSDKAKAEYKKRKLLVEVKETAYKLQKGVGFTLVLEKQENDLTAAMIHDGSWKTRPFKPYNFNALGALPETGHLHPLLKVRTEYRQIFLEMGFTEMPTNNFIESSFWNFDTLFVPQKHPARDTQDTFFISDPKTASAFPMDYLRKVETVHGPGDYGSIGYGYEWQMEETEKNVLRTHTTAVSARMLYKLAQEKEFRPVKYFSIDRVFRNENLDATHLAEFHQIEGLVADHGLTLGHLMGVIKEFFTKLGINKLRFKPAYNPYTEPSMEIFGYHEGLGKWVEIGNSGVFRPEMLLPMGLPSDVSVIAWGLSLERPTMIKYGIKNIRDLIGPKVNLQMVYDNPICRLDK